MYGWFGTNRPVFWICDFKSNQVEGMTRTSINSCSKPYSVNTTLRTRRHNCGRRSSSLTSPLLRRPIAFAVVVHLRATGDAPILKQTKFKACLLTLH
ncbi:hypothetical protein F0562_028163 [Nyssa sinensis]|uniref:Uncharacterized protein n=1 Tax=Nyssa sinensis TaxID=561372 RepID=A0A5J5B5X8_9ASTE|nr:hypothetical protein F0562_028163 [Nyssa sinensis]